MSQSIKMKTWKAKKKNESKYEISVVKNLPIKKKVAVKNPTKSSAYPKIWKNEQNSLDTKNI